jgi:hypothetical protein
LKAIASRRVGDRPDRVDPDFTPLLAEFPVKRGYEAGADDIKAVATGATEDP